MGERVPPDLRFRDSSGAPVRLGDLFAGRPVVLSLVYYDCPMLCPMAMGGLASSLKALDLDLGRDFDVLTVSFNPNDTTAAAAEARRTYLGRYGRAGSAAADSTAPAGGGWRFLTGGPEEIRRLTEAVGFRYRYDAERGQYAHAAGVVVLTPGGEIARYLFGIEYPPKDLRLALVEAGRGEVGSAVDRLLLYCFHYDPATGKYTAATLNLVRAAAVATVLALGGFIVVMRRRERRAGGGRPERAERPERREAT
jgi:protein SCO1/2